MENDVEEPSSDGLPPWCTPTRAKDMFGVTGEIIRNLLDHRCDGDLMALYGVRPEEAKASLHFADLASLPVWDAEILAEVAGVANGAELAELRRYLSEAKRDIDKQMWSNQLSNREEADRRLTRRIRLAMLSEKLTEIVGPASGLLFLRRAGIEVPYELRDAVAIITIGADTDEGVDLYRELMGLSTPASLQEEQQVSAMPSAAASSEDGIPGKPPKIGVGRVAIEVAWTLECELGHRPTAKQVMTRLRELANNGNKFADILRKTPAEAQGVSWITKKGKTQIYSDGALVAALGRWTVSRQ